MIRYVFSYSISDQLRSFQIDFIRIFLLVFFITTFDLRELKISLSSVSFELKDFSAYLDKAFLVVCACGLLYSARLVREFSMHVWSEARAQLQYLDEPDDKPNDSAENQSRERSYSEVNESNIARKYISSEIFFAERTRIVSSMVVLVFDAFFPYY